MAGQPGVLAKDLVVACLRPDAHVDFPQITEICERLEAHPSEVVETVAVISAAIREGRDGNLRRVLQALTIANEMTYHEQAVSAFRAETGLQESLAALRLMRDSGQGGGFDENVRMLATEVERACFVAKLVPSAEKEGQKKRDSPLSQMNWQSFERKASQALQRADKWAEKTAKNVETTTLKAGSALDRMATTVMSEVGRTFTSITADLVDTTPTSSPKGARPPAGRVELLRPGLANTPSTASAQAAKGAGAAFASRQREDDQHASGRLDSEEDDWQLQWAVNESLLAADQDRVEAPRPTEEDATAPATVREETARLRVRIGESRALVMGLEDALATARAALEEQERRCEQIKALYRVKFAREAPPYDASALPTAATPSVATAEYEAQLLARVAELEAQVAATTAAANAAAAR